MPSSETAGPKAGRWISILGGPVLSLVAFVLTYWLDPLNFGSRQPMAALPALFLSIIILMMGQAITTVQELQRSTVSSDRIYDAIKNYLHVTPVGSPEEAFRYIGDRMPVLREVRNTSFNVPSEVDRTDERLYDTSGYLRAIRQIPIHCSRSLIWKDLGDIRGVERLRAIQERCERATKAKKHGYRFRLIRHQEPQINFIVLEFVDGAREVLFNWDFRGAGQDPTVLLSRDREIVEMFSIHFAMLWNVADGDPDESRPMEELTPGRPAAV